MDGCDQIATCTTSPLEVWLLGWRCMVTLVDLGLKWLSGWCVCLDEGMAVWMGVWELVDSRWRSGSYLNGGVALGIALQSCLQPGPLCWNEVWTITLE